MNTQECIRQVVELREEISLKVIPCSRDQYESSALLKMAELLAEIEAEYISGNLKPKDRRYAYISRLVAETDPEVLPTELGGKLMQVERRYIDQT